MNEPVWTPECEDPVAAINFAIDELADYEVSDFLYDWRNCNMAEWPEFLEWVIVP